LGELLQFKVMVAVLAFPVLSLGWVMSILQQGLSALDRMALIMDEPVPEPPSGQWKKLGDVSESGLSIKLNQLSYAYPDQEPLVIKDLSLEVKPGEVIGVTGPIGCGKSTLMHILTGICHPKPGQYTINGVDVTELDPEEHHQVMAFCPQDAFLFSRPLSENIGLSGYTDGGEPSFEKVKHHATEAALDKDIQEFNKGYDEWVGERGVTLSGGQRQRTALARALYKDAPLLILDDALSAVDANTEGDIMTHVKHRHASQSMIIVSHRISAIRHCDRIIVLSEGRCVEDGTHEALMDNDQLYRHLADLQQMEQELEVVS
jgi:ABC-type multidrug transport system fused ATPase/permease subunit